MVKVVIYSTQFCPYCVRAKSLLKQKGVEFTDIRVDIERERYSEMIKLAGRSSVPQIFIDDDHVGGCDDLYALEKQGQLDHKLGLAG
jgi:glutaredoxin 3